MLPVPFLRSRILSIKHLLLLLRRCMLCSLHVEAFCVHKKRVQIRLFLAGQSTQFFNCHMSIKHLVIVSFRRSILLYILDCELYLSGRILNGLRLQAQRLLPWRL